MKPLSGQRVIDVTQIVAGPYCTEVLADLGAEIIKIERPGAGDDTRHRTPQIGDGMSATYATFNRGKPSVALDLDHQVSPIAVMEPPMSAVLEPVAGGLNGHPEWVN